MLLNEFFGKPIKPQKDAHPKKQSDGKLADELFWFFIDHDKLHKDHVHPVASKIKKSHDKNKVNREELARDFMPMVKKGCKEYYAHKKLTGHLSEVFPKDLREELCERLFDHYYQDVIKKEYKLAESKLKKKKKVKYTKAKENTDQGGGKMFGNTAGKLQAGNDYPSTSHLKFSNGGVA